MEKIINQEFGGERPLYCKHDLYLENVKIHAGESALKETGNITAVHCQFEGKIRSGSVTDSSSRIAC